MIVYCHIGIVYCRVGAACVGNLPGNDPLACCARSGAQ